MNYKKIDELFGAPLNQVIKPHIPYKFKMIHAFVGVAVLILVVKGVQKLNEDLFKGNKNNFLIPLKAKDDKKN
jgi:hypothetical protein